MKAQRLGAHAVANRIHQFIMRSFINTKDGSAASQDEQMSSGAGEMEGGENIIEGEQDSAVIDDSTTHGSQDHSTLDNNAGLLREREMSESHAVSSIEHFPNSTHAGVTQQTAKDITQNQISGKFYGEDTKPLA